jgi:hypothetical protein
MAPEFRTLGETGTIGPSWVMIEMTPTAYYLTGRGNGPELIPHIAPSGFPGGARRCSSRAELGGVFGSADHLREQETARLKVAGCSSLPRDAVEVEGEFLTSAPWVRPGAFFRDRLGLINRRSGIIFRGATRAHIACHLLRPPPILSDPNATTLGLVHARQVSRARQKIPFDRRAYRDGQLGRASRRGRRRRISPTLDPA